MTEQTAQATEYVILESKDGTGAFTEVGRATAASGSAAIRKYLEGKAEVDGYFVAPPARSWKPQRVRSKVALDFGEPS